MPRALATALLVALCFAFVASGSEVLVHLDGLVPWPALGAIIPVEPALVSPDAPFGLIGWETWLPPEARRYFGSLVVGSGGGTGIFFIVAQDSGGDLELAVDQNGDSAVSEDELLCCENRIPIGPRSYSWLFTAAVEYVEGGTAVESAMQFQFSAVYSHVIDDYRFFYGPFCQKTGELVLGAETRKISITTVATDATYDQLANLMVAVDTDGDGRLNTLPSSHEVYGGWEPLQVGSRAFVITSVSEDGQSLRLNEVSPGRLRVPIERGREAPVFSSTTLAGDLLVLEQLRGSVALLLFFPRLVNPDCESCYEIASEILYERFTAILDGVAPFGNSVQVVIILEKEPSSVALMDLPQAPNLHYVHDLDINTLYRRTYSALVIDQMGIVRALDEAWVSYACPIPRASLDELHGGEIAAIVKRLLDIDEQGASAEAL